jgi:single-stranded DNA-binding protein
MPSGHNELTIFSIDEPDMAMFDSFSDGLKQKIQGSPEWQERNGGGSSPAPAPAKTGGGIEDMDDDIPF